jgi:hypothetical protein
MCGIWSLTVREEDTFKMLEKRKFRGIFRPKNKGCIKIRDKITQSGVSRFVSLIKYY